MGKSEGNWDIRTVRTALIVLEMGRMVYLFKSEKYICLFDSVGSVLLKGFLLISL